MYNLKKNTVTVTLGKEEGDTEELTLTEMTAAQRDAYLDRLTKRIKHGPDGKSQGVAKFEGLQADLISSCLCRGKVPVPIEEIQKWPASVVAGIFKEAQDLNRLGQEVQEASDSKNG
jgi:hypothetical protein